MAPNGRPRRLTTMDEFMERIITEQVRQVKLPIRSIRLDSGDLKLYEVIYPTYGTFYTIIKVLGENK
jgi:hypothetical protein